MDSKKIISALIRIAENQQKIIQKLAQAQGLPPDSVPTSGATVTPGKTQAPASAPPVQKLPVAPIGKTPAASILAALPANIKALLGGSQVEVHDRNITALAKPNQPDQALDAIQKAVQDTVQRLSQDPRTGLHGNYTVQVRG